MGWVEDLHGTTVGVDTSPFIYLVEEHPAYLDLVAEFFSAVNAGQIIAVTSTVTLLEVLVQPFRRRADHLANDYQQALLEAGKEKKTGGNAGAQEEAWRLKMWID